MSNIKTYSARLFDAAFPQSACQNAAGENAGMTPQRVTWLRGGYHEVAFFTDSCLNLANDVGPCRKIAWLLEPPPFRQCNYDYVRAFANEFDYVLTYDARLIDGRKFLYYPYGGSRIAPERWGIKEKSRLCSIIVSAKDVTTGHKVRHAAVQMIRESGLPVDVLGCGYGDWVEKYNALAPYYYSIVIEGESLDWCFDEKLIDAFAVGTLPLFWGCPHIGAYFNKAAILPFTELEELRGRLLRLTPGFWESRLPAIHGNLERARAYLCAEDWIAEHYPFLFEV